ncbi:flavoprotein [Pseudonocardia humida]|uniref:Flavoprotein n=1 Tax=Pseudonocardia humida TaxID=2800819 RepID=A0ABT1A349_9PSEU|nr:flavoprotein [Pseudonocardia humida]MCO1657429.1 flavoprotein [Pseudonocardia humida]
MTSFPTLGLVGSGAGGVELIRAELVQPLCDRGWQVAVTLTPTAGEWLRQLGEIEKLEQTTGLPVRVTARQPGEQSPHPRVDGYAVVPASANTVAKLATGIADNQALTTVCEALGAEDVPVVVFPRVNAAHARHPAWKGHIDNLRTAGVELLYGEDVWPLHEPRTAPGRDLPWQAIRDMIVSHITC